MRQFLKSLPSLRECPVVVDVGSGGGVYLRAVNEHYDSCFCVGIDPQPIKRDGVHTVKAVAEFLPFKENSVDLLFITASLDHFQSPERFADGLPAILRSNGYFMLMQGLGDEGFDPTHLHAFTEKRLAMLFCNMRLVSKKKLYAFAWLVPNSICRAFSFIYSKSTVIMLMRKR